VGSLSPTINWGTLARQEFPLPPLAEQRRLADLLWAADDAICQYEALYSKSEQILASLLLEIFTNDEWKQDKLENHVIESLYGPRFSNTLYSDDGEVACLRTTDLLADGTIIYSTVPRVKIALEEIQDHILKLGDFMISRSGTCGIACVFEGNSLVTIPGAFLIRLRLKPSLNPLFLREYINSPVGKNQMDSLARGAVQKNIRGSLFLKEDVPVPDLSIQDDVVKRIKVVRDSHKQIAQHIETLRTLKKSLLNKVLG
jgi:type I restriction enzyme S subunit